jgi:hypothetical protein
MKVVEEKGMEDILIAKDCPGINLNLRIMAQSAGCKESCNFI